MNQFKKAKQQAMKTGHYNESVTDLNTAGVVQTSSEPESVKKDSNKNTEEVKQSKSTKIQITEPEINEKDNIVEATIIENPEPTPIISEKDNNKTGITPVSTEPVQEDIELSDSAIIPADTLSDVDIPQENISFETSNQLNQFKIEEQSPNSNYEPTYPAETYPSQEQVNVVPTNYPYKEQPIYRSQEHNVPYENHNIQQPVIPKEDKHIQQEVFTSREQYNPTNNHSIDTAAYVSPKQGIPVTGNHIEKTTYISQEVVNQTNTQSYEKPDFISQEPASHSYAQPNQTYHEPATRYVGSSSKSQNSKKNIPNIFSPKGEAKSMRKSLVLKPTSVKIAENYCAKNGGSFNELIQTLLDNFIDEYGL